MSFLIFIPSNGLEAIHQILYLNFLQVWKRYVEAEDEDSGFVPKKKAVEKKGTDDKKGDVRGKTIQEKEKQIMVKKKKLNDQEK